jgi:hypothetical protein
MATGRYLLSLLPFVTCFFLLVWRAAPNADD